MKEIATQNEGERLVGELVRLAQSTASETIDESDGRGLARLEQSLYRNQAPARHRRNVLHLLVAAMTTVALLVGGITVYRRFEKLTYEVMNGTVGPGGFVRPTAAGTTILFSEGSEISLGESTRTRVDSLTADGGRVVVESGSVQARIVHRKKTHWFVEAGPYTIRVTGTAFNVKWSWQDETLALRMDRGSVVVTGPLAPAGVTLTAGMRLTIDPLSGLAIGGGPAQSAALAGTSGTSGTSGTDADALAEQAANPPFDRGSHGDAVLDPGESGHRRQKLGSGPGPLAHRGAERRLAAAAPGADLAVRSPSVDSPGRPSPESWDEHLARGDVQGILSAAEIRGIDRVLATASGRELSALADAARYGHLPVLARRTLLSMRDRFPRSSEARDAAFFLGGLAEDGAGATGDTTAIGTALGTALNWYDRYLGESPHGRYVAQALGRKMVMTQKQKGFDAARPIADEYLGRFPNGPYAPAARKLMRAP